MYRHLALTKPPEAIHQSQSSGYFKLYSNSTNSPNYNTINFSFLATSFARVFPERPCTGLPVNPCLGSLGSYHSLLAHDGDSGVSITSSSAATNISNGPASELDGTFEAGSSDLRDLLSSSVRIYAGGVPTSRSSCGTILCDLCLLLQNRNRPSRSTRSAANPTTIPAMAPDANLRLSTGEAEAVSAGELLVAFISDFAVGVAAITPGPDVMAAKTSKLMVFSPRVPADAIKVLHSGSRRGSFERTYCAMSSLPHWLELVDCV